MTNTKQQQVSDWAFQHTADLERPELSMYNNGFNVPTIGVGYAAIVKGSQGWAVKDTLKQDFNAIGASLSSA